MGNKKFIFISLLILAVGFSAVSTTLYITGNVAYQTNKNDFDVYFSGSELDGVDVSNIVIKDKKHIEYTSNELKSINDTSTLMYEVTNDSTQYNATVTISCTPMKTDYIEVTLDPVTFDVAIGESKQGNIMSTLTSVSEEEQDILISCELTAIAVERESSEVADIDNRPYSISGVLNDAEGNPLSKKELAVFSDKKIVKTDRYGYFYVSGLERGTHHIYYNEDGEYSDNEEDLEEYELALAATNGVLRIKNKDYKIEDFKYGKELEDETVICPYENGKVWDFGLIKEPKKFEIECTGTYKLEVWGAQGGTVSGFTGGYGGYSVGYANLYEDNFIYVVVGGPGSCNINAVLDGGYNGGGKAYSPNTTHTFCSGGGATHISTISSELRFRASDYFSTVYLVAGGGGGSGRYQNAGSNGGNGGGASGTVPSNSCTDCGTRTAGTQTSGGTGRGGTGSFGLGANSTGTQGCGGGGGLFGGGADSHEWGAQGGSGFINSNVNGTALSDKAMYCYACGENTNAIYKTISTTGNTVGVDKTNCPSGVSGNAISKCAKSGAGHARITLISLD